MPHLGLSARPARVCGLALVAGLGIALSALPAAAGLYGLWGSYYSYDGPYLEDLTFSDPGYTHVFDRMDSQIAFGWSQEYYSQNDGNGHGFDWEPLGGGGGAFGVMWDGWLRVPEGDPLYLATESDDGSFVFINGELVIDNGGQHWPWFRWSDDPLKAGDYHIQVFLFANDLVPPKDKSGIDLWWSPVPKIVQASEWVPAEKPVPEPTSLALLAVGLGAMGFAARRRLAR